MTLIVAMAFCNIFQTVTSKGAAPVD